MTPHGSVSEKKSKVFPAMIFDIIRHAVKTPVRVAYKLVLVEFSNLIIYCFSPQINFAMKLSQVFKS
jgi:hypothetical protein